MINLTVITLAAMLIAFFMVVYQMQKSSTRRRRVKQDFETLKLAKQLKCDTRKSENLSALGLKPLFIKTEKPSVIRSDGRSVIVFAVVILCPFLLWSIYLISLQLIQSASLMFAFALACMLGLIRAKRKILEGAAEHNELIAALESYERELSSPIAVSPKAAPAVRVEAATNQLEELYRLSGGYCCVPQDSTLKRHFLTKAMNDVADGLAPRPTDSTLKRHYDTLLKAKLEQHLQVLSETPAIVVKPVSKVVKVAVRPPAEVRKSIEITFLPEESALRRHVLGQLRRDIESGFGARPADSMLRRHYDAMVDVEFDRRVRLLSRVLQNAAEPFALHVASKEVKTCSQAEEHHEHLPEDSTLRRHFLTELREKIASKLPPRPSDFNLLRHYNAMVQAALEKEVEEHYS